MTFVIPKFRLVEVSIDHPIDVSDFLENVDVEDVLKILAQKNSDFETILFKFIDYYFQGSFEGFVELFKPECE